jgi:uncharacterized protein YndB with AHSA1/START domain
VSADPLIVEFAVAATPAHAFDTWTRGCSSWWPAAHTISGDPTAITFEPRAGGRIFEQSPDGDQHDWGTVLEWHPPTRLRYRWHLFFDVNEATEIDISFAPVDQGTAVRLEQRGWDRLGPAGPPRRTKTERVWSTLAARFIGACVADVPPGQIGAGRARRGL